MKEEAMDEVRNEVVMKVDGMRNESCAEAVRRTIRALDPGADVHVDVDRGEVRATTRADTLEVTAAVTKAGYNATAMTG
jgi:copper chaperone